MQSVRDRLTLQPYSDHEDLRWEPNKQNKIQNIYIRWAFITPWWEKSEAFDWFHLEFIQIKYSWLVKVVSLFKNAYEYLSWKKIELSVDRPFGSQTSSCGSIRKVAPFLGKSNLAILGLKCLGNSWGLESSKATSWTVSWHIALRVYWPAHSSYTLTNFDSFISSEAHPDLSTLVLLHLVQDFCRLNSIPSYNARIRAPSNVHVSIQSSLLHQKSHQEAVLLWRNRS